MRGLNGQRSEERLLVRAALLQVLDKEVGQLIRLVAGQAVMERVLADAAVDPRVPLAVVILVPGPGLEPAALVGVRNEHGATAVRFLPAEQVPFAEPGGLIPVLGESVRDRLLAVR